MTQAYYEAEALKEISARTRHDLLIYYGLLERSRQTVVAVFRLSFSFRLWARTRKEKGNTTSEGGGEKLKQAYSYSFFPLLRVPFIVFFY